MHLKKRTFECEKCGQCCKLIIKLTEKDITRIERAGHDKDSFLAKDPMVEEIGDITAPKDTIKQVDGYCFFLISEGNKKVCSIYPARPDICRTYPFVDKGRKLESCKPYDVYNVPDFSKYNTTTE